MAHEPDTVASCSSESIDPKHVILAAIAALFLAVLFTFGFLMAHARETAGNAKLLFGGGCRADGFHRRLRGAGVVSRRA